MRFTSKTATPICRLSTTTSSPAAARTARRELPELRDKTVAMVKTDRILGNVPIVETVRGWSKTVERMGTI
jgi:hypothetical protein